jgi:hypothetical protein
MAVKVMVYSIATRHRSRVVCEAMVAGIRACGDSATQMDESQYAGVSADIAVFYGLEGNTPKIFRDYRREGKAVYIDLGYWARKTPEAKWDGYHKIVVNDRHPTEYFQRTRHDGARFGRFGMTIQEWRRNGEWPEDTKPILLAGMGDKGAVAEGYEPEEWERWAIDKIRDVTRRTIMYRPKPSWKMARPIHGKNMLFSPSHQSLDRLMKHVHCVVTHHSNVAIDGLLVGVPCFVVKGAARPMGSQDFSLIETPLKPDGREQLFNDLAYCQWSVSEMRSGAAWSHLRSEGLV